MHDSHTLPGRLNPGWALLLFLLPIICALVCLCVGRIVVSPDGLFHALTRADSESRIYRIIWNIRLPRVLLAALVGAGLSVAGCVYQSLFANPLATPDTIGAASGASFGAALGILLGFKLIGVQIAAVVGGLAAMAVTVLAGWKGPGADNSRTRVVLAGIIIGSLFSSLLSLVKFTADPESELPAITYWLLGSLSDAGYRSLLFCAPPVVAGIVVLWALRWRLNVLPLSDDEAKTSGVNIRALRLVTIFCSTTITASCVSMCGQVGWVGLLVPHICRMKFGDNHLALIPACVCVGAAFMILVDTIARSATTQEIPISILTALFGAPFFIYLMRRKRGWNL
jgi:iron complex transport system permease protein